MYLEEVQAPDGHWGKGFTRHMTAEDLDADADELDSFQIIVTVLMSILCLYGFLLGLALLGDSFKVITGRGVGGLFGSTENPLTGLAVGVLATAAMQSSSTTTRIVVSLVAEGSSTVNGAIPIVMGANLGSTLTNTFISISQSSNHIQLQRSFAAATSHDMVNLLTVAVLFPLEAFVRLFADGGPLFLVSRWLQPIFAPEESGSEDKRSLDDRTTSLEDLTELLSKLILSPDKNVINLLALKPPENGTDQMNASDVALCLNGGQVVPGGPGPPQELAERRLTGQAPFCTYTCIRDEVHRLLGLIFADENYDQTTHECSYTCPDGDDDICVVEGPEVDRFHSRAIRKRLIAGGFTQTFTDTVGGIIAFLTAILLVFAGIYGFGDLVKKLFNGEQNQNCLQRVRWVNSYFVVLLGFALTCLVQSSSAVTSAMIPLAATGILPLRKVFAVYIGANVGTTVTSLANAVIESRLTGQRGGIQIALVHFLFNVVGMTIWFVFKPMRAWPLYLAKALSRYASFFAFFPVAWIIFYFGVVPASVGLVGFQLTQNTVLGVFLLVLWIGVMSTFWYMWMVGTPILEQPLSLMVLSQEKRDAADAELLYQNQKLLGTPNEMSFSDVELGGKVVEVDPVDDKREKD